MAVVAAAPQVAVPFDALAQATDGASRRQAQSDASPSIIPASPLPNLRPSNPPAGAAGSTTRASGPLAAPATTTTISPAAAPTETVRPLPTPSTFPEIPTEGTTACAMALAVFGLKAEAASGLGDGECRVTAPVRIAGVGDIEMTPKALVDCVTAATIAVWLRDTVAPRAQAMLDGKLTAVRVVGSYTCRATNNVAGANLSEHARGRALDIGAFKVGQRWITVGSPDLPEADQDFLNAVRASACGPFTTVLGPGSDPEHHDHLHIDVKPRQTAGPTRGLFCQ
jgi:hypothetical protein